MTLSTFADLEQLPDFEIISDEMVLPLLAPLRAKDRPAADTIASAAGLLFNLPPHVKADKRDKVLRNLPMGHLVRLWRYRGPSLPMGPSLAQALGHALEAWRPLLEARIAELRPAPLDLGRFEDMPVAVFRRRLAHYMPTLYQQVGYEFSYAFDHYTLRRFFEHRGPSGPSARLRELIPKTLAAFADAAGDGALRAAREAALEPLRQDPRMAPALDLVAKTREAVPMREATRARLRASFDPSSSTFAVTSSDFDACLEDSCAKCVCVLDTPSTPKLGCHGRTVRPCSLHRATAELFAEALAGRPVPMAEGERAQLVRVALADPAEHLLRRLDTLIGTQASPGEELGWLLTPFERLDLVWLTPKKRGGLKSKRLTLAEAREHLTEPRHLIAASLLQTLGLFQEKRYLPDGLEVYAPVLAALAGDNHVYLHRDNEIERVAIEIAELKIAPRQGPTGLRFALTLGPVELEAPPRFGGSWVAHLDAQGPTLRLAPASPALRAAFEALPRAAVPVPEPLRERVTEALLKLDRKVRLVPDASWLGERHELSHGWVLRLEWAGPRKARALHARLGVRVVPELGALRPGDGEPILPVRRQAEDGATHIGHVERDLHRELREAHELAHELGLDTEPDPLDASLTTLEGALALLERAQALAAQSQLELAWSSKPLKLQQGQRPDRLRLQLGMRKDWLDLQGGFVLDGGELPLTELLAALRDNKRFVEVDDETILELGEEVRRSLAPLAALAREHAGKLVASPLSAPLVAELEQVGASVSGPPEWLGLNDRMREASTLNPPLPRLDAELRPYQLDGFRWLARLAHWAHGACLADDMGLGKTLQALALITSRAALGPTLVIAPTSVVPNWVREARRFAPDLVIRRVLQGAGLDAALADLGPRVVLVTSWDLLVRHEPRLLSPPADKVTPTVDNVVPLAAKRRKKDAEAERPPRWATLVLDEAQAMKNPVTRRAQSARAVEAEFVLALTGTPVENRPMELWSLFSVVAPGLLGSAEHFRDAFARPIEERSPDAARQLSRLIRPFLLRRTKGQVATDLPQKSEVRVDIVLTPEERERYQRVRLAAVKELDALGPDALAGQKGIIRILAVLTRLRQLACHSRLVDRQAPASSSKLDRLVELADELRGEGRKMLVFSQFTELLGLVREAFDAAALSYAYLDGSTPGIERERAVELFQAGEVDAFLLSLKAGGVGLNLTTATEVIHLDPWWNPAVEDQASDRAHRIGQDKPVTIYRLVANATIEEQILGLHGDKRKMVSSLLEGTASAAPISHDEMLGLLLGSDEPDPTDPAERPDPALAEPPPAPPAPATIVDLAAERKKRRPDAASISKPLEDRDKPAAPPSPAPAAPAPAPASAAPLDRALALLGAAPDGLGKRALCEALGLDDGAWLALRAALNAHPGVTLVGATRAAKYLLHGARTP